MKGFGNMMKQLKKVQDKMNKIQEELATRKKVERAKGILMREKKISEEDAYRLMQRYSMNKRKSMREIAEAIITAHQIEKF